MSDGSGAGSSSPSVISAAHVASTMATASSQETEIRWASTVSSASSSEGSTASIDVSNSATGVLAPNGPAANGPTAAVLPPCIEGTASASNCASGSSDPAAARVLGFKIGSAI